MKFLQVAPDHRLPAEMLTDSTTIIGRKRSGKSNDAVVIVEETLELKGQVIIIDPKGDWWGITSSADGKSAGYPVVVLGGKHAQLALNVYAGAAVADWVIDTGHSVIIDLQGLDVGDVERFCSSFLWQLRRRQEARPKPILLVIDEADELAPEDQRERINVIKTLRIVIWCVKRGGFVGIGTLVITQRPASLNKNVLSQTEVLVILQVTSAQDLDAITDALRHHVEGKDKKERATALENLLREIVKLQKGSAVIVSGQLLKGIFRIPFRRRKTFDSGATPKFGQKPRVPKVTAKVALAQLSEAMEKAVAEAKSNDPTALQKRIKDLERQLRDGAYIHAQAIKTAQPKRVEVPVLNAGQVRVLTRAITKYDSATKRIHAMQGILGEAVGSSTTAATLLARELQRITTAPNGAPSTALASRPARDTVDGGQVRAATPRPVSPSTAKTSPSDRTVRSGEPRVTENGDGRIGGTSTRLLAYAVTLEDAGIEPTARSLAAWTGIRPDGGHFGNVVRPLRAAGLLDGFRPTAEGRASVTPIPLNIEAVRGYLKGQQLRAFDAISAAEPDGITAPELAKVLGVRHDSGHFGNIVRPLRQRAVVTDAWPIRLAEPLRDLVPA
jgi:hypothetical protein